MVAALDPYVGKYFSLDYVRRHVLKQKDEEIIELDKQMKKEIKDGKVIDPMDVQAVEMGLVGGEEEAPVDGSDPAMDPNAQAAQMPKGGEI